MVLDFLRSPIAAFIVRNGFDPRAAPIDYAADVWEPLCRQWHPNIINLQKWVRVNASYHLRNALGRELKERIAQLDFIREE
jgi:hypothetical protein